ncbi:pectate lyase family protein [Niastella populi]|uniref:Pectate lyase n=1 Tax=Niastella populi TaxID=550983 RepID=A0A1V9FDC5_9BACT|nr:pectate lyase [Niastella populi]OQP56267.1 pectate lyase [Niastella populi]
MKKRMHYIFLTISLQFILFSAIAQPIAFPGAEGFGRYTTGGRGGRVIVVNTLNDDGPGSFRKAVQAKEPRIIVFAVSGTIHLQSKLEIKGNVTIAGQTAPGDGICLADHPVGLSGDNIIVRYLRFRMGDKNQNKGMVDGGGGDDAFGGSRRKNIVIDHCSMSWSTDEAFSVYNGDSTTLQWNLIAEPLNYSYHFETGDKDFERHGYGGIWGGKHTSAHHNLFAHCNSRNPRFDGIRNSPEENVDFRNNVIYNWGGNNAYAGEGGNYNIVNNYYRCGPETKKNVKYQVVNPWSKPPKIAYGKWFVDGNYVDGSQEVSSNNWLGVRMGGKNVDDPAQAKATAPFSTVPVTTQPAKEAFELVLKQVGCSLPKRDTLDERIIDDVKHRKGRFIDVQGGYPHGTPYEATVNAWPALNATPALPDKDQDGMPDEWETANGLNPGDAADAAICTLEKQYTNIEMYVNGLVK